MVRVLWLPWLGAEELESRDEGPQKRGRESRMGSGMGTDLFAGLGSGMPRKIVGEVVHDLAYLVVRAYCFFQR